MTLADTKTNSSNPSPYSTSGGGYCYENFVQSSFVLSMLAENNVHTFPNSVITKIALQGRYANYATDDCILFLRDTNTNVEHKFLLSIKKTINITKSCNDFKDSLFHAWVDFNETTFNKNFDHIGLVTSFLTKTDNENVKTFLQWAKHCDSAEEFYQKIDHNRNKKEKYDVFHELLIASNNNQPIRPELLWQFLKSYEIIIFNEDIEYPHIESAIRQLVNNNAPQNIWHGICTYTTDNNKNAGTITPNEISENLTRIIHHCTHISG